MRVIQKEYDEIRNCMQPGDVIAFSGENFIMDTIRTRGLICVLGILFAVSLIRRRQMTEMTEREC